MVHAFQSALNFVDSTLSNQSWGATGSSGGGGGGSSSQRSPRQKQQQQQQHHAQKKNLKLSGSENSNSSISHNSSSEKLSGSRRSNYSLFVVATQILFLAAGYSHAWFFEELDYNEPHISAILDDDLRSLMCAGLSFLSFWALIGLELSRTIAFKPLRLALASVTTLGITLVCLVRESHWWSMHAGIAGVVFGAGWLLVGVVTLCHPGSWKAAAVLSALTAVVGTAQGLSIGHQIGYMHLPKLSSSALACGECSLIVAFGICVVTVGAGGGSSGSGGKSTEKKKNSPASRKEKVRTTTK